MIRRPPRSTQSRSSAASDVYKETVDELIPSVHQFKVVIDELIPSVHQFKVVIDELIPSITVVNCYLA